MIRISNAPDWRVLQALIVFLLAIGAALAAIPFILSPDACDALFTESGPFEQVSPWLWLALGGFVVLVNRKLDLVTAACLVITAACAAREWDLHKTITGYSVLKPKFYLSSEFQFHQQIIAGIAVALLGASVVILIRHTVRVWPRGRQPVPAWMWAMFIALAMLVGTKILDRAPNILLEDFEIALAPAVKRVSMAWEEGYEAFIPIAFGAMALAYRLRNPSKHATKPTEAGIDEAS